MPAAWGAVLLAEDATLGRQVLAPTVAADPERRARVEREAPAVAALNHPNIITTYSVKEQDGVLFMTMELICPTAPRVSATAAVARWPGDAGRG